MDLKSNHSPIKKIDLDFFPRFCIGTSYENTWPPNFPKTKTKQGNYLTMRTRGAVVNPKRARELERPFAAKRPALSGRLSRQKTGGLLSRLVWKVQFLFARREKCARAATRRHCGRQPTDERGAHWGRNETYCDPCPCSVFGVVEVEGWCGCALFSVIGSGMVEGFFVCVFG